MLFLAGAIRLIGCATHRRRVQSGQGLVVAGATVAFLVWFFGFMVVAGEWFAMWQSKTWNGQEAAFRFYMAVLGVLIFVACPITTSTARRRARPLSAAVATRSPLDGVKPRSFGSRSRAMAPPLLFLQDIHLTFGGRRCSMAPSCRSDRQSGYAWSAATAPASRRCSRSPRADRAGHRHAASCSLG